MSRKSESEVTLTTSTPNKPPTSVQGSTLLNLKQPSRMSPISPLVVLQGGQQRMESTRLLFQCEQSNFSNIYALAQANLVQQTQQDIMKLFSSDISDIQNGGSSKSSESSYSSQNKQKDVKYKEEQHICEMTGCGRAFSSAGYLKNHQLMHAKEKALECHFDGCGRKFSWPAHLKYHLLTHQKTRNFTCPVEGCAKSFVTGQQLKVHSRTHTGEKPFKCDQCQKAFTTAGNLKNHTRIHTGDKPYECPESNCNLKFAEYSSLKKHSLVHSGKKPFKCDICNRSFTQSGSMRVHMKKHMFEQSSTRSSIEEQVVMTSECSTNNSDYQVVYSNSVTNHLVSVTKEQQQSNVQKSSGMFIVQDLFTKESSISPDNCSPANVVVVSLPQLSTSVVTSYQNIPFLGQEEIIYKTDYLVSDYNHEETVCDVSEGENKTDAL